MSNIELTDESLWSLYHVRYTWWTSLKYPFFTLTEWRSLIERFYRDFVADHGPINSANLGKYKEYIEKRVGEKNENLEEQTACNYVLDGNLGLEEDITGNARRIGWVRWRMRWQRRTAILLSLVIALVMWLPRTAVALRGLVPRSDTHMLVLFWLTYAYGSILDDPGEHRPSDEAKRNARIHAIRDHIRDHYTPRNILSFVVLVCSAVVFVTSLYVYLVGSPAPLYTVHNSCYDRHGTLWLNCHEPMRLVDENDDVGWVKALVTESSWMSAAPGLFPDVVATRVGEFASETPFMFKKLRALMQHSGRPCACALEYGVPANLVVTRLGLVENGCLVRGAHEYSVVDVPYRSQFGDGVVQIPDKGRVRYYDHGLGRVTESKNMRDMGACLFVCAALSGRSSSEMQCDE